MNSSENSMEDKYKFVKVVGRGAFGSVYRAIDKENGKTVAIKKIEETYQPWETCFNTEVKALKKFGRHPNIISLKEAMKDDSDNTMYLVFEYMPSNLYDFIEKNNKKGIFFGETQIKKWCFQILRGLDYMHRGGFFHCDLKPQNLLVSESGDELKIADFGSARLIDDKSPCTKYVGTRWYHAPEVMFGSTNYGPAVDMWAVGAILAELYMGPPIFPENSNSRGDQVYKICSVIGNPTVADKLSFADNVKKYQFPKVKSSSFKDMATLMPSASEDAISLFKWLCSWDPSKRPSPSEALHHQFFFSCYPIPKPIRSVCCRSKKKKRSVCSDKVVKQEEGKPILRPPPGFLPLIPKKSLTPPPSFLPLIPKKSLRPPPGLPSIPKIAPPCGSPPVAKIPPPPGSPPAPKIAPPPPALPFLPHMVIAHNRSKCF